MSTGLPGTTLARRAVRLLALILVMAQLINLSGSPRTAAATPAQPQTAQSGTATPTPTITPAVVFDLADSSLCQIEPGWLTVEGTVRLPVGQQAVLQTAWYVMHPADLRTPQQYQLHGQLADGDRFSAQLFWPGIRPTDTVVENHIGAMLLDPQTMNPLMRRGASLDFYWYPWVCPAPIATPTTGPSTATPTPTPTSTPTAIPVVTPAPTPEAPRNTAPVVNAGPDQRLTFPRSTTVLTGSVTDDGLPATSALSQTWSVVFGPGLVTFADRHDPRTSVSFGKGGVYQLRLTASDGALTRSDDALVVVLPENTPPLVDAGPDRTLDTPQSLLPLQGDVRDDGLPDLDALALSWELVSGPGSVSFGDAGQAATTARFSAPGVYTLRLSASDTLSTASDILRVTINRPPVILSAPPTGYALPPASGSSVVLNTTIRDFSDTHPDFQEYLTGVVPGLVASTLGPDNTPTFVAPNGSGAISSAASFAQWFHDSLGVNQSLQMPLTLEETAPGSGIFAFVDEEFFPIDHQLGGNQSYPHNFHFTLELHASFTYRGGEVFHFTGDDDIWLFINKRLVVDLGGIHRAASASVRLDDLGLTPGEDYDFEFFFAERHCCGSSFRLQTSLQLNQNEIYRYPVQAQDPEGDPLTYRLVQAPAGMQIDPATGLITWQPPASAVGEHVVEVAVDDGRGSVTTQRWTLQVVAPNPNQAPAVEAGPDQVIDLPATLDLAGAVADDGLPSDGVLQSVWTVARGNGTVAFAAPNQPATTAAIRVPGVYVLRLQASDGMLSASDLITVTARLNGSTEPPPGSVLPAPPAPPAADLPLAVPGWLGSPANRATITVPTPLTLPTGVSLTWGALQLWPADRPQDVTTLATDLRGPGGTALAMLDPTLLANGSYVLRLYGTNAAGETLDSGILVTVAGEYKPGRVRLSEIDLTIPLAGLPIQLGQTYDSLERGRVGDFGYGWTLDVGGVGLRTDPANHVTLSLPNGLRRTFFFTPQSYGGVLGALQRPAYTPEPGFYGTLTADGCPVLVVSSGRYHCFLDTATYRPATYTYTDPYGRMYTLGANGQLREMRDLNGNTLMVTPNGITSSAGGMTVPFVRDTEGRIAQITDPVGMTYRYAYDAAGDLVTVTPPDTSASTTASYSADHLLRTLTDGRGITVLAAQYTTNGRLQQETDGAGNTTRYAYDLQARTTTITNPDGGAQTLAFDTYGMLVAETDPLGRRTTRVYDERHQLLTRTDALSATTSYAYTSGGHRERTTDALGRTTRVRFNNYGSPSEILSTDGVTVAIDYDAFGLPLALSDATGVSLSAERDTQGLATSRTDGVGATFVFTYDRYGNVVRQTDTLGASMTFAYDELGRRVAVTDPLGNTTATGYDPLGQTRAITDAQGFVTRYTYDPASNMTSVVDALGQETRYQYNGANRLTGIVAPDGGLTSIATNWRGQRLAVTDPLGRVTRYHYDLAGQLTSVTLADGTPDATTTTYTYDAAGRRIRDTGPLGEVTSYTYDRAGQLTAMTDPLGYTTTYTYTPRGQLQSQTNPLGAATTYSYDARGRLQTITTAEDQTTFAYDGANRLIAQTDATGRRTRFSYNTVGQLIRTTVGDGTADATVTQYQYDLAGRRVATIDGLGNIAQVAYDARGYVQTVTDPLGAVTRWAVDGLGRTRAVEDALGSTTRYQYDWRGAVLATVLPDGSQIQQVYDRAGQLLRQVEPDGRATAFSYDAAGRVVAETRAPDTPNARTTRYAYDAAGRRIATTDPLGFVTHTGYDAAGQVVTTTDALSGTTRSLYDAAGNLRSVTDANGQTTTFAYDAQGRLVETRFADGSATGRRYDAAGRLVRSINERGVPTDSAYDGAGRLQRVTRDGGPDARSTVQYRYDAAGRMSAQIDPHGAATLFSYDAGGWRIAVTDALSQTTLYGYDAIGRTAAITDALGFATRFSYDVRGQLIQTTYADGSTERRQYDRAGRLVEEIDALNRRTTWSYDLLGQLVGVTDALQQTTAYRYDAAGRRTELRDPLGRITTTAYDALGRPESAVWPDGRSETWTYDPAGNVVAHRQVDGQATQYRYDARDRLLETRYADGQQMLVSYTPTGQRASLTRVSADTHHTTSMTYDGLDRLTEVRQSDGLWLRSRYDTAGNRTALEVPGGVTTYTYDALGQLTAAGLPWGGSAVYTYDAVGQIRTRTLPNGVVSSYTYNGRRQLTSIAHVRNGTTLASYDYTLDAVGNRVAVTEAGGRQTRWSYDAVDRLLSEFDQEANGQTSQTSYTYDAAGNRQTQTRDGQTTTSTYNDLDQLLQAGAVTYRYDGRGNLTEVRDGADLTRYTVDAANQVVGVSLPSGTDIQYQYGPDGQRVAQTVDGAVTRLLWDQAGYGEIVATSDGTSQVQTIYALGASERLGQQQPGAATYALADGQRSVRVLADASGQVVGQRRYSAFGEVRAHDGAAAFAFGYSGEQQDEQTGLINLRARLYDPALGRFLGRDVWPVDMGRPVELNRYVYAQNNPLSHADPTGLTTTLSYGSSFKISRQTVGIALLVGLSVALIYCRVAALNHISPICSPEALRELLGRSGPGVESPPLPPIDDDGPTTPWDEGPIFRVPPIERPPLPGPQEPPVEQPPVEQPRLPGPQEPPADQPPITIPAPPPVFVPGPAPEVPPAPEPQPPTPPAPRPSPEPSPSPERIVEYEHLTTEESADNILATGLIPIVGGSSGNDPRFFAVTMAARYQPQTTLQQRNEMLDEMWDQLRRRMRNEGKIQPAKIVHIRLPERTVRSLERSRLITYGPFFPNSSPGYTESIFEVGSFPTINQHRANWFATPYP